MIKAPNYCPYCGAKYHPNFYAYSAGVITVLFLCGTEIRIDETEGNNPEHWYIRESNHCKTSQQEQKESKRQ